jgi:hypothetical protein
MMDGNNVWPPPPTIDPNEPVAPPRRQKEPLSWRLFWQTAVAGLILGIYDVHQANIYSWIVYSVVSAVVSFRQPRYTLIWSVLLCTTLYVCHIVAISLGSREPYVENSVADAFWDWQTLIPFGLSGLLGIAIRALSDGVKRRRADL